MTTCLATITDPHKTAPGLHFTCTLEPGHLGGHVAAEHPVYGQTNWNDHHDGATPHRVHQAEAERDRLKAAILDIDAHATPMGLADPNDPDGNPHHYAVTVGALHRALGKIGHTAAPCTAEAVVERVRRLADEHPVAIDTAHIHAALAGEPGICEPGDPAATQATEHVYLSTGCLHGRHDYCSNVDGIAGLKKTAQCKFCAAPCRCGCHQEQAAG